MNAKREFAKTPDATATPDFLQNMANKTVGQSVATQPQPNPEPKEHETQEARPIFRERNSTQRMAVNMPKDLYEELRAFMKMTDTPMSDILVDGARRELARRKRGGE